MGTEPYTPSESEIIFGNRLDETGAATAVLTDCEVSRGIDRIRTDAKAKALCEFADAVRMPFVVFRRNDEPVYVGDLMREVAARIVKEGSDG